MRPISTEDVLLTPNKRLSQWLQQQHQRQQQQQCQVWQTATILPFNTWLTRQYQLAQVAGEQHAVLLNNLQEQLIWEKLLQKHPLSQQLLQTTQSAKLLQQAFQLCQQWKVPLTTAYFSDNEEAQLFLELSQQFVSYCQQYQFIAHSQLVDQLLPRLLQQKEKLIFHGFIEFSTEQQQLINALKKQGRVLIENTQSIQPSQAVQQAYTDSQAELLAIVKHCQRLLTQTPHKRFACIIPTLAQRRDEVSAVFDAIIPQQYNISAAQALSDYPIVHSALGLLSLLDQNTETVTLNHLICSPFIVGAETEMQARMLFMAELHKHNVQRLSLTALINWSKKTCPQLATILAQLITCSHKQSYKQWAAYFHEQLKHLGWPGERAVDSHEYQTIQRFFAALDELGALDCTETPCHFKTAVQRFKQLCQQISFQAQSKVHNIQILGHLEASGMTFDEIWLADMNEMNWPANVDNNAFIPLRTQRAFNLPRATAERTLQFYQALTQQFFNSSKKITCSFAKQQEGLPYQISPLLQQLPTQDSPHYNQAEVSAWPCENLYEPAIPLKDKQIKGGTYFFKAQSACPFQAFARYRLHAESITPLYFALNDKDRGIIIHKLLQDIWQELKTQETLLNMSDEALYQMLNEMIERTLQPYHLSQAIAIIEKERLKQLLFDWLQQEITRPPFTVKSVEQLQKVKFNGLEFNMRADRIDEYNSGEYVVIDYKSKKVSLNDCYKERLAEPQLPLYALQNTEITQIAFAQVRRDELKFLPSDDKTWQTYKTQWQHELKQLSDEIKQGVATVTPREEKCCKNCDLQALCRIHQAELSHE